MLIFFAVLGGFILDAIFGDPLWLPHPVVYMGKVISFLDRSLRKILPKTPRGERIGGAITAFILPVGTFLLSGAVCFFFYKIHWVFGLLIQMFWCAQSLAAKGLVQESCNVYKELKKNDLPAARKAVSRIVGRDTDALSMEGVTKAAVETVAENAGDGVIAPLLCMLIGGAPLALTYKAINTMDSMLGYKNEKYINFGRVPAKLDDAANYIPSRIAALLWVLAAWFTGNSVQGEWKIWRRDRRNHHKPQQCADRKCLRGALGVQLAGPAYYFGEYYEADDRRPAAPGHAEDILKTDRMMYAESIWHSCSVCSFARHSSYCKGREYRTHTAATGRATRAKFDHDALDFSANVGPSRFAEGRRMAIVNALPTADRYPDPLCRELRQSSPQAKTYNVSNSLPATARGTIFFGSCSRKSRAIPLLPAPTFAEYASALKTVGCEVEYFF